MKILKYDKEQELLFLSINGAFMIEISQDYLDLLMIFFHVQKIQKYLDNPLNFINRKYITKIMTVQLCINDIMLNIWNKKCKYEICHFS